MILTVVAVVLFLAHVAAWLVLPARQGEAQIELLQDTLAS